jgi:gluconate kinase
MPSSLLASQLAALEPLEADESGVTVTTAQPTDEIVAMIRGRLPSSAG